MKFEEGKFYIHDTSEYEYSDKSKQYLYCREIIDKNAEHPNDPFLVADLIGIDGEGMSKPVYADGTPYDGEKWYTEVSREEFALALLDAAIKGDDYLSEQIRRRKIAEAEEKEKKAEKILKGFNFGF
jgi:hypothetical protein